MVFGFNGSAPYNYRLSTFLFVADRAYWLCCSDSVCCSDAILVATVQKVIRSGGSLEPHKWEREDTGQPKTPTNRRKGGIWSSERGIMDEETPRRSEDSVENGEIDGWPLVPSAWTVCFPLTSAPECKNIYTVPHCLCLSYPPHTCLHFPSAWRCLLLLTCD